MSERSKNESDISSQGSTKDAATDVESPVPEPDEKTGEVERQIHGVKWFLTVCAILSCIFLFALDTTVVCSKTYITHQFSHVPGR